MDKRVIFSVAGSGKTTHIINNLDINKRSVIVTYTNNNLINLRQGIVRKFGLMPSNFKIFTYFTFLHSFCYKPFLVKQLGTKGINYISQPNRYSAKGTREFYIDANHRLYSARISKLILEHPIINDVNERLSKYFDYLYIDEAQDLAGNDFNFLMEVVKSNVSIMLVGDFHQHTFDTSRDGNTQGSLFKNYTEYKKKFIKAGYNVDLTTLNKSWRCSPAICSFVSEQLKIPMESNRQDETEIKIINTFEEAVRILHNSHIVKLFYQKHYSYRCFSRNWGDSKGEDKYNDVAVVLNKSSYGKFRQDKLNELSPTSRNKLYVAITRTRNNLYFIPEEIIKAYKT